MSGKATGGRPKGSAFVKGQKSKSRNGGALGEGYYAVKGWCYVCGAAHRFGDEHKSKSWRQPGQYILRR